MHKKNVTIFTLLPLAFSLAVFSFTDSKGSVFFVGGTLLIYLLFNLYLDITKKSIKSKKIRGFSAYLGFLLVSVYLIAPAFIVFSPWLAINSWILMMILAYIFREAFAAAIFTNSKKHFPIKFAYFVSIFIVVMLGGGGSYRAGTSIIEALGDTSNIYFSLIATYFSFWIIIYAQSSTTRFTKFTN